MYPISEKILRLVVSGEIPEHMWPRPLCIVKDRVSSVIGDVSDVEWKAMTAPKGIRCVRIDKAMALRLISLYGLERKLSVRGWGDLYDTPDGAFRRKYTDRDVTLSW